MRPDGFSARMRRRIKGVRTFVLDYAYVFTLGAALTVMGACGVYTRMLHERQVDVHAAAEAMEIQRTPDAVRESAATPAPSAAPASYALRRGGGTVMPVSGGVVRGFDRERPVLWEALSCWRVHAAADIAGAAQEKVCCVMDGTVERTVRDELWGWRVEIAQTDGSLAEYAGLLLCQVQTGQHVTRGQTIGVLMDAIPCEAELGPHLHLALYSGGEPVDPAGILPQRR